VRLKTNFVSGFKLIWVSGPGAKKSFFPKIGNCGNFHPSRSSRGALAIVTNVGRDAMDAEVPLTSGAEADGEIVWSWRRDAGVKSAEVIPPATVAKEPFTGESTYKPSKPFAQGRPDQFGEPVVITLVCFLTSHARLRVHWAPGFPCALYSFEGRRFPKLGQIVPRERGCLSQLATSLARNDGSKHPALGCEN
jgi:hypothetical protein